MMQVWLVLLGAVLLWQSDQWAKIGVRNAPWTFYLMLTLTTLGYGCLVLSVVLVFVNGGTTG
jgi:hypothetical protein